MWSNALIAVGETESGEVDVWDQALVGVTVPAGFEGAALTFLVRAKEGAGAVWTPVYDAAGAELSLAVAAGRTYTLSADFLRAGGGIKVVSDVVQAGAASELILFFAACGA